ncbi:MAG: ribulose-phosphate 3-epimerase [Muribaculaceae bacterium]|nr:ribulose-phosphate 3-epimerase [Muribaculaceae bacterium]MDE6610830.1 ribulose-phosphate 3-epimerase [Muribaculaceae bacterium]
MLVSPSILSADFANLGRDIEMINRSEASMIHVDVMDGVFVPNISIGFPVIEAVGRIAKKPLDVHLMIVEPHKYVAQVRDTGAEWMNVHLEVSPHLDRTVQAIKQAGMKAAVTLNPATPVSLLKDIVAELDMVLLMSVNPGFGGQKFIGNVINKIRELKTLIAESGSHALIEVDGGINATTAVDVAKAGCDVVVAGSYVFGNENPEMAIAGLAAI